MNSAVQTLAILGAGAWAVYTFIYEARIVPGRARPTLSVTSALERVGERGDLVAIRSTVTRSNVGQAEVRVLGLTYNVVGIRNRFLPDGGTPPGFDRPSGAVAAVNAARHYEPAGPGEVILRQGVLFEGATALPASPANLNPGEVVSRDLVFYADRSRFDSLRFEVTFTYTKASDPPLPLVLRVGETGEVAASPGPACQAAPGSCGALTTTDFTTEFSLWPVPAKS